MHLHRPFDICRAPAERRQMRAVRQYYHGIRPYARYQPRAAGQDRERTRRTRIDPCVLPEEVTHPPYDRRTSLIPATPGLLSRRNWARTNTPAPNVGKLPMCVLFMRRASSSQLISCHAPGGEQTAEPPKAAARPELPVQGENARDPGSRVLLSRGYSASNIRPETRRRRRRSRPQSGFRRPSTWLLTPL